MSTKISQLTSATDITASDLMQIVDVEDGVMAPSGTNKKITAQLLADDLAEIVSNNTISGAKIIDGTITSAKITDGSIVNADINASAAIAGSKISPSFTTNSSITVNSSSPALTVTQSGAGANLFVNGSYSQFLNDGASVNLLISTAVDSNQPSYLQYRKYRGTHASPTAVQDGDSLGSSAYYGYDGDSLNTAAFINVAVDGPVSNGIIPTRFGFSTQNTSGTISERMRVTSSGDVGIGTTSPSSKLHVAGDITVSSATTATSATAGTNGDVPAQVVGYLVVNINGTARKIPYYA